MEAYRGTAPAGFRNTDGERILFWILPALAVTWVLAFVFFPGFAGPMSPTLSADQVAAFYRNPDNLTRIRYSMIVFNWFGIGLVPMLALITMQIARMAHGTPILTYCYLGCLTGGPALFFIADLFWLLAAFRPQRDPALTQMFNDIAWVTFSGQVGFLIANCVFLALAIFLDRQKRPVFAGWVAPFNLLVALALAPSAFVALSPTGIFAWDGVLSFWVRNSALGIWLVVMMIVLGRNIHAPRTEEVAFS